jgi:hypothetical protein
MFDAKCRIKDLQITLDGQHILSLYVPASVKLHYDELKDKDLRLELKPWRERRSLDANAYFHVLVGKIAEKMVLPPEKVKHDMVLSYGTVATDENGAMYGIMIPINLDVNKVYKYAQWFDTRTVNGAEMGCYKIYTETHLLDAEEMNRLITGVVFEAEQLGIETITPAEKAKLLSLWGTK